MEKNSKNQSIDLDYNNLSNSIYIQGNFEDYNYFDFIRDDLIKCINLLIIIY